MSLTSPGREAQSNKRHVRTALAVAGVTAAGLLGIGLAATHLGVPTGGPLWAPQSSSSQSYGGQSEPSAGAPQSSAAPHAGQPAACEQTPGEPDKPAVEPDYESDRPVNEIAMLLDYKNLEEQPGQPAIKQSIDLTVALNNRYYDTEVGQQAVAYSDHTRLSNVTVQMGPTMKGYLDELTAEGELPHFRKLLADGADQMQPGGMSPGEDAKPYFGVVRPLFQDVGIKKVPDAGTAYAVGQLSFPSGHSRYYQVLGTSLAVMLPELAPQMLESGSAGAESRPILGVHTVLDVIGGKSIGTRMVAQRLADDEFRTEVFEPAMHELRTGLEEKCGTSIAECARIDFDPAETSGLSAKYRDRLTYGLDQSGEPGVPLPVPAEAEALLITRFPELTPDQRAQVLALTAIDSGYPLDLTGAANKRCAGWDNIGWSRIDLAAAMDSTPVVLPDGSVTLQ